LTFLSLLAAVVVVVMLLDKTVAAAVPVAIALILTFLLQLPQLIQSL
jgi:hypothetical protein